MRALIFAIVVCLSSTAHAQWFYRGGIANGQYQVQQTYSPQMNYRPYAGPSYSGVGRQVMGGYYSRGGLSRYQASEVEYQSRQLRYAVEDQTFQQTWAPFNRSWQR